MSTFKNKVVVVTGGNSGIGLATAKAFVAEGAQVVITGRKKELVDAAVKDIGPNAMGVVSDTSDLKATDDLVAAVKAKHGRVDSLFINAGVALFAAVDALTEEQFDSTMDVNFKGAFFTLQKFLPLLGKGSNVTFLSSLNAYTGMANTAAYAASKAALNSLMRTASTELAPRGIRVNSVNPGPVRTPILGKAGLPAEAIQAFTTRIEEHVPLKRLGTSEEIADLVLFLSSDKATFMTGSEVVIDGGLNINAGVV